jgi:hypothetical protein
MPALKVVMEITNYGSPTTNTASTDIKVKFLPQNIKWTLLFTWTNLKRLPTSLTNGFLQKSKLKVQLSFMGKTALF